MDLGAVVIIIIIGIILVLVFYIIGLYSRLVNARNKVDDMFMEIDKELKKIVDLIPDLVEVVKKIAKHEENLLNDIINSKNIMLKANSINKKITSLNSIRSSLDKVFVLTETYKELKKDSDFNFLQEKLKEVENKIDYASSFYNDTAKEYNNLIIRFPFNTLANIFKFKKVDYFNLD